MNESMNMYVSMQGRILRGLGDDPPKIWGGGTAHAFVPQYFANYCYWMWGKVRSDWKRSSGISSDEIEVLREERVNRHWLLWLYFSSSVWDSRGRQSWVDD